MRNYEEELKARVAFIQEILEASQARGIVYGNSGGKDSALVGILCKKACAQVLGVMLPCGSQRNYNEDMQDALALARQFDIEILTVDLTQTKAVLLEALKAAGEDQPLTAAAMTNIAPRLRMTTLYALAQSRSCLVAGTGNRSEGYMGYFTKWGDGAYDLNPIGDLTVTEIYEFLRYLGAPAQIIDKAPSAGLYEGQTDEKEMGITYKALDQYLLTGAGEAAEIAKYQKAHERSAHKRQPARVFGAKEILSDKEGN
ncbi:MAG TPA: NAD(+) synthase [Peptococcaceae bacterium]|nr:NAD(+) synthase [Peptococcaceae bacterium]